MLLDMPMTERGPDRLEAGERPAPPEPLARLRSRRPHRRKRRQGPLVSKAGWAFLAAMLASAVMWATFIAIVAAIAHHHLAGRIP